MHQNDKKVIFSIERMSIEKKFDFPLIKNLNPIEIVKIYENFRSIFPMNNKKTLDTKVAKNLKDILDDFDVLLLDAFGVLNIGKNLVQGIKETLEIARDKGIILLIVTNGASYNSARKINQLYELGLDFSYDEIISSRDVAERFLSLNSPGGTIGIFGNMDKDIKFNNALSISIENNLNKLDEVNSILFLGTSTWDPLHQDLLMDSMLRFPRPFFVANPDIIAPHENKYSIEPGFYSFLLINAGVNLPLWFGKPFSSIFELAIEKIENLTGNNINLSRVGMVGDTLHTDILGANSFGIKSVLMTGHGFLKNQKISSIIKETTIIPDYIVQNP